MTTFRVAFIAGATANEEFRDAMALSEFDGLFIDPQDLRDPDAALLARRRKEIEILLSSGGVVMVFARPLVEIGTGVDNYSWLLNRPFDVVERAGVSVHPVQRENPLRTYFDTYGSSGRSDATLSFEVVLEGIPDDLTGRRVIAENRAAETIGLLYRELKGTVVILPPISEIDDRFRAIIREVIHRLGQRRSSIELAPPWVRALPPLPGEQEHVGAIAALDARIADLAREREAQINALEELRDLGTLLWETGELGLRPAVSRVLSLLGYGVEPGDDVLRLDDGGRLVLCAIDAADGLVQLNGFRKLHEAVTETLLETGNEAAGILLGNGNRLRPLDAAGSRPTFSQSCLNGCTKFGYAAVPAHQLYHAAAAVLREAGKGDTAAAIRRGLLETRGEWESGDSSDGVRNE